MDGISENTTSGDSDSVGDPIGTPSGLAPYPPSDNRRTVVDVHAHLWHSLDQLGPHAANRIRQQFANEPWDQPDTTVQAFDQAMEPVDYVIVHGLICEKVGVSIPAELVARYVAHRPDKYLGFTGVDPTVSGYLSKVTEAIDLGLVGVTISPAAAGFHPSDSRAMRLYERCEEQGLPVLIHGGGQFGPSVQLEYSQPFLFDEVARSFPDLRLVLGGIGLPWVEQALVLVAKHPHCYTDLSELVSRSWQLYQVLLSAYQQGAMDGLLLASDFPFITPETAIHNIYSVNTVTHGTHLPIIPREQLRSMVERDSLACLGLTSPPPLSQPARDQLSQADDPVERSTSTNVGPTA